MQKEQLRRKKQTELTHEKVREKKGEKKGKFAMEQNGNGYCPNSLP